MSSQHVATLIQENHQRAISIARRILVNREDAEDAVQNASIRAVVKFNLFKGDSSFSTWYFRIVSNEALQILRRYEARRRKLSVSIDDNNFDHDRSDLISPNMNPEQLAVSKEIREMVRKAIINLPSRRRRAVLLRIWGNQFSNGLEKALFFYGKQSLKKALDNAKALA